MSTLSNSRNQHQKTATVFTSQDRAISGGKTEPKIYIKTAKNILELDKKFTVMYGHTAQMNTTARS